MSILVRQVFPAAAFRLVKKIKTQGLLLRMELPDACLRVASYYFVNASVYPLLNVIP